MFCLEKIVSGGQTGADRAGLDFAIKNNIAHGGWCPAGRLAEDGKIAEKYRLEEMESADYSERTEKNVLDSDGTAVFSLEAGLTGGSKDTVLFAKRHNKPWIHISFFNRKPVVRLRHFLMKHDIKVLNVAGPRASKEPGIEGFVESVLKGALRNAGPASD